MACLSADRAYDGASLRAGLATRGVEAVMPARAQRANLPFRAPERYPARHEVAAVSNADSARACYAPYQRRLGFLYLAWHWALAEFKFQHNAAHRARA